LKRLTFLAIPRIAALLIVILTGYGLEAQVNFTYQSSYSYLKGSAAQSLSADWMKSTFNYSGWSTGNAPFHYGDGTGGVELSDMQSNYTTLYLRSTFNCTGPESLKELSFIIDYDDGFAVWVNGVQALSVNAPSTPAYNSTAPDNHESGYGEVFTVATESLNLAEGTNFVAVQAFNVSSTSTDFYFDMTITGEQDVPEYVPANPVVFNYSSGFYDDPFELTISTAEEGASLVYTLDGSNPQSSATSFTGESTAAVSIDPSSTDGRPATPCVVLRASIVKDGYKPSKPLAATYIFIDKVRTQSSPGGGWPTYNINGQSIDLEMDSKVVNNTEYSSLIDDALLDIPSISVITGLPDLFDPATGIYVNAEGHGLNWEKECSVELINPDGTDGFNVNAGLRIRGGWSRHDDFPKHSFRLFFREEYGNAKLNYPLFGEEGTDEYDKVDLRTSQNYAWANGYNTNTMVREVFSRDSQRDLGQPYTRSRYYHLYLNGMYWGLYQTQERSEARYAESYFGGDVDDYDVVKVNTEDYTYRIEATDGNLDKWRKIWNLAQAGFESDEDYYKLEGRNEYGEKIPGAEVLVDIDNLIDYMLVIFYSGNFDAPTSSFGSNKGCNNFYAIDNRNDLSAGYTFYAHDSEHAMFNEAHSPGIGIEEDRVNLAERNDDLRMEVYDFTQFHPQWLHHKLCSNAEYRIRFSSRACEVMEEGGALYPSACRTRLDSRVAEIQMAIIAESARWGDAKTGNYAYTKNVNWNAELNKLRNTFIPSRTAVVIAQLKEADLFPSIKRPVSKISGTKISDAEYYFDAPLSLVLENPASSGTIYFTLDGSDPRQYGGAISSSAKKAEGSVDIPVSATIMIRARIKSSSYWSGIKEIHLIKNTEDYSGLKITELHYHPEDWIQGSDTIEGSDLEFIELKNTGSDALNIGGVSIDSAVHYTVPGGTILLPKKFYVVASKPSAFFSYYQLSASGNYKGNLSNGGEEVLLSDPSGNEIFRFTYMDDDPWPKAADGSGKSLCSVEENPKGNPADYSYWTVSVEDDGNPFRNNYPLGTDDVLQSSEGKLSVYPNPASEFVRIDLSTEEEIDQLRLTIYDMTGAMVYKGTLANHGQLNLSEAVLKPGLCLLRIEAGSYSGMIKLVRK